MDTSRLESGSLWIQYLCSTGEHPSGNIDYQLKELNAWSPWGTFTHLSFGAEPAGADSMLRVHVCHALFLELQRVASVKLYLSQSATARLVTAVIVSHPYCCSSVFWGVPADQITWLQQVQTNAAWLVTRKTKQDHVTPLLRELHWLPVKFCCQYKIATTFLTLFISLRLPTASHCLIIKRRIAHNPKVKPEICQGTFF